MGAGDPLRIHQPSAQHSHPALTQSPPWPPTSFSPPFPMLPASYSPSPPKKPTDGEVRIRFLQLHQFPGAMHGGFHIQRSQLRIIILAELQDSLLLERPQDPQQESAPGSFREPSARSSLHGVHGPALTSPSAKKAVYLHTSAQPPNFLSSLSIN